MNMPAKLDVILLAAGQGTRLKAHLGQPKQFATLHAKPVWQHALDGFRSHPDIGHIILVFPQGTDRPDELDEHAHTCTGGILRQDSVHNGLQYLASLQDASAYVAIHDCARPFVPAPVIDDLLLALHQGAQAVIPAIAVADTIKRHRDNKAVETLPRDELVAVQTPQAFSRSLITSLHQQFQDNPAPVTDDASLAEAAGIEVQLITGSPLLHKLTTAEDFDMAQASKTNRGAAFEARIGNGFDVHRFIEGDGPIALCGLQVPHDQGLDAHSDGDVGLHALCDAIFGALGEGDIGQHFPPSDERWRDAASDQFLAYAAERVAARSGHIINLDVTIICERPKIGPLREEMRTEIARIAGISRDRVSVKATTSERLGFTGRGEGIAAMASACISVQSEED